MLDYEWAFMVFGLTIIVALSQIMAPVRDRAHKIHPMLGTLISCPMCFGFWAGIILNLLGYSHYGEYGNWGILFDGFLGTAFAHTLYCVTWFLGGKRM